MATDWKAFADEIYADVLLELGTRNIVVEVPDGPALRDKTGKKIPQKIITYTGAGVMGKYDSEFISKNASIIQAGDVKFVVSFDDRSFEPSEKKEEVINCEGTRYSIINVGRVAPDGKTNVVFVIQARRIN